MSANNGAVLDVQTFVDEARAEAARNRKRRPGRRVLARRVAEKFEKPLEQAAYEVRQAITKLDAIEQAEREERERRKRDLAALDSSPGRQPTQHPQDVTAEPHQSIGEAGAPPDEGMATTRPAQHHMAPAAPARGAKFVSWVGFWFGAVMSIAANILHAWLPAETMPPGWWPGLAPQVGSAVWPIGLLLSVEVLSRVAWRPGVLWGLAKYGGAGLVALGSGVISYGHLREVLLAWDYGVLGASVGPLVLDGLMVVSGFALLSMSDRQGGATP